MYLRLWPLGSSLPTTLPGLTAALASPPGCPTRIADASQYPCLSLLLLPLGKKRHHPPGHLKRRSYVRAESLTYRSAPTPVPSPGVLQGGCSAKGVVSCYFVATPLPGFVQMGTRVGRRRMGRRSTAPALRGPLGGREPRAFTLQGHTDWTQGQTLTQTRRAPGQQSREGVLEDLGTWG